MQRPAQSERLEVGVDYEAIGPAHGSKLGPPSRVTVESIDEDAGVYRVKGKRMVAPVIRIGCEHMWKPAPALAVGDESCGSTAPGAGGVENGQEPSRPPARGLTSGPTPAPPPWHDGRMVAFDLETTAPYPEGARIVTAAVAVCGGGLATETLSLLADPGVEIPEEAAAIHGITTERARAEGTPVGEVLGVVLDTLELYLRQGLPLVGFNIRYDLTVQDREARRHGLVPLTERGFPVLAVDPLVIDKHLDRYRKGSRKLDAQCAHYGANLDDAHDAAADAIAAARVAWCIAKRGQVIRRTRNPHEARELAALQQEWESVRHDLAALHAAQTRWALAERTRFAEYKRSIGEHEEATRIEAEIGWPVLEQPESSEAVAA